LDLLNRKVYVPNLLLLKMCQENISNSQISHDVTVLLKYGCGPQSVKLYENVSLIEVYFSCSLSCFGDLVQINFIPKNLGRSNKEV